MPIDINNISNNAAQTKRAGEQKHVRIVHNDSPDKEGSRSSGAETASLSEDSVRLTGAAMRIKSLEEQIARLPIVDTQKVEQVKSLINDGKYELNSARIADKMISFERNLL